MSSVRLADVNGQHVFYSVHGAGKPLVRLQRMRHDGAYPEVEFWKALGGGQRDAGIDGSLRPANQLAIVPNTTHYSLAVDPMPAEIVERFLGTE